MVYTYIQKETRQTAHRAERGIIMLKLVKVGAGEYLTEDGTITVGKDDGYWYAADVKTSQSVVDSQRTLKAIKESLEWYLSRR